MCFKVTEYEGDYPCENQPSWYSGPMTLALAVKRAKSMYDTNQIFLNDKSYYVLVETDRDLGVPVVAFTSLGELRGDELRRFLDMFGG